MSESTNTVARTIVPQNSYVNFFHFLVVAPALVYVLFENYSGRTVSKTFSIVAMLVVLLMFVFHAYLAYKKTFDYFNDAVETKDSDAAPKTESNSTQDSKKVQEKQNQDAQNQDAPSQDAK